MDFFSYLENLRQKPTYIRKGIAFWASAGITLAVFLFWFSFITLTPISTSQKAEVQTSQKQVLNPKNIFEQLKAGVIAITNQFR